MQVSMLQIPVEVKILNLGLNSGPNFIIKIIRMFSFVISFLHLKSLC